MKNIPAEILDDRIAIVGTAGSGKTVTAKSNVERLLDMGARVCCVDPLGVWWGLRSDATGKKAGYPITIFGGEHGDLPLSENAGPIIAEAIATGNFPSIVDLSELPSQASRRRFMKAFAETLYAKNRDSLHLVMDEADMWCPQRPIEDIAQILGARVDEIVRRGRVRGFIPWLITQRPAVIHKDVLSQLDTLVAMKLTSSQDRDALDAWIEGQADKAEQKRIYGELPKLQVGEGFLWSPGHGILQQVKFPMVKTFDSSRTPKRGERIKAPSERASVDLEGLRARLATVEQESQANDPKALRTELATLRKQVAESVSAGITGKADPALIEQARDEGFRNGHQQGYAVGYRSCQNDTRQELSAMRIEIIARIDGAVSALDKKQAPAAEPIPVYRPAAAPRPKPMPARMVDGPGAKLGKAERAILTVLAQYPEGRTKTQIAILCGYAHNSGSFSNALGSNRTAGRLEGENIGVMRITETGLGDLGSYDPLPHGRDLLDHWLGQLGKAEAAALRAIVAAYPARQSKEEVAEATGYAAESGSFSNALGKLRTLELIEGSNAGMRASDDLFG